MKLISQNFEISPSRALILNLTIERHGTINPTYWKILT